MDLCCFFGEIQVERSDVVVSISRICVELFPALQGRKKEKEEREIAERGAREEGR